MGARNGTFCVHSFISHAYYQRNSSGAPAVLNRARLLHRVPPQGRGFCPSSNHPKRARGAGVVPWVNLEGPIRYAGSVWGNNTNTSLLREPKGHSRALAGKRR